MNQGKTYKQLFLSLNAKNDETQLHAWTESASWSFFQGC